MGDATVMRLSTPEPSADGITWSVEQDLTRYQDAFADGDTTVSMYLGNTVDETYTGGWSNPYMWMPTPSPYAFNIPALQYDLPPFAGVLNDGEPHEVRFHVVGHPKDGSGWSLMPNLFAWTDHSVDHIPGAVTETGTAALQRQESFTGSGAEGGSLEGSYTQQVTTSGYLDLPSGRVRTTVTRNQTFDIFHGWSAGETSDDMDETSVDRETVLQQKVNRKGKVGPGTETVREVRWTKDGTLVTEPREDIEGALQVRTDLAISHGTETSIAKVTPHGKRNTVDSTAVSSTYDGWGDWTANAPRTERVATAASTASYTVTGKNGKTEYAKTLVSKNGWYVED